MAATGNSFVKLKDDAFWHFLFGKHPQDKYRKTVITNIIKLLQSSNGALQLDHLIQKYLNKHGELLSEIMNNVLCTSTEILILNKEKRNNHEYRLLTHMLEMCTDVFKLIRGPYPQTIRYVCPPPQGAETQTIAKNIFKSSTSIILAEQKRNVKIADKVFEMVAEHQKVSIEDILQKLYADTGANLSGPRIRELDENPHISPFMLISYLELYWSDVYKFETDYETGKVYVRRQVMHHQKPSQETKYMEEKMNYLPTYPLVQAITDNKTHEVVVNVENFSLNPPSDGFFLQLVELNDHRRYIEEELRLEWNRINLIPKKKDRVLHPNVTRLHLPCIIELDGRFQRCVITGQSNGKAMVQCVDIAFHGLVDIEQLYHIPNHLIGIYQTGVYGVLDGKAMEYDKTNRERWNEILSQIRTAESERMNLRPSRVYIRFMGEAVDADYSGRRKHKGTVYKVQLSIQSGQEVILARW